MKALTRYFGIAAALVLAACGGLPRSLRDDIAAERDRLPQAQRQLQRSKDAVNADLAEKTDLFNGASVATEWPARLRSAQDELDRAKKDGAELDKLAHRGGDDQARKRAERLIRDERNLREAALRESDAVEGDAHKWLDFRLNLPHYLAAMQQEYDSVHAVDLSSVAGKVQRAGRDWPAKKADLDARLASLRQQVAGADSSWSSTQTARQEVAAGNATGREVATLIQANDLLVVDAGVLARDADRLSALSGQLYNALDKILTDLDKSREGQDTVYRERLKTVKTHYVDVPAKKTEVTSDESWVDVPAGAYQSVENDLGMAIAHKDAGLYDSEAQTTPQPAGFAYIASPSVGSNQYGYWQSGVWTWLPEYLVMRELFWGHSYRPVVINEYNGYETARRYGRSYYGRETPASPPKYGTHGTFTEQHYAGSRYVQSGGYKSSASARPEGSPAAREPESGAGKRFGGGASRGRRFGSPGGSRSVGRSFGRRR